MFLLRERKAEAVTKKLAHISTLRRKFIFALITTHNTLKAAQRLALVMSIFTDPGL